VQQILDSMTATAAYVRNGRLDILAAHHLGQALYADVFNDPVQPPNTARFLFLNPRAPEFFVDWDTIAHDGVAILRAEAGRDPHDRRLSDLIGELATRSEELRVRWAAHNVKFHRTGANGSTTDRGGPQPHLRSARPPGRQWATDARLHRGARLTITRCAAAPRQLGDEPSLRRHHRRSRRRRPLSQRPPRAGTSARHT
jgi:hypothetical protein